MHRTDLTAENGALVVRVEVLGFLDRYPSTQLLAQRLDRDGADLSLFAEAPRRDERSLFTPIDRWGHQSRSRTSSWTTNITTAASPHVASPTRN
ncbi:MULTISPECIES: hypothetical protein [unclassified Rhodococcus (in: high G+C Gram-positive bacteria)]|uniref:hypothetical protein n=1 Tax=unclassified Rhodococcus (in: high G+C Gram-positive bacteria) TaxID=192944 RepID=UPI002078DA13|nr:MULTISPECIES: hypothetical protein [unclassified Rhodococcus (in: high G+C Gram-positive bacteria)]